MVTKFLRKIFFIEILQGMVLTMKCLFSPAVTRQYPDEKHPAMLAFRGLHALVQNPDGTPKCVHCGACKAVCPSQCIHLSISKDAEGKPVKHYEIDILRCVFCGLCVESCPYGAIMLTGHYEYCSYDRLSFRMRKPQLLQNWENYVGNEKSDEYFAKFWSPKSEDYSGSETQAVFDPERFRIRKMQIQKERK